MKSRSSRLADGELIHLSCPACGYRSGGLLSGRGMAWEQPIHLCRDCGELASMVVRVNPQAPESDRRDAQRESKNNNNRLK